MEYSQLFAPPSAAEWSWVYGPLVGVLLLATVMELRTRRIPNWLNSLTLLYFIGIRSTLGPEPISTYLWSVFIVASLAIGIGFLCGYVGGGAAKLATAVSVALLPIMALVVCLLFVAIFWTWYRLQNMLGRRSMPGSVMLLIIIGGVVAAAALQ